MARFLAETPRDQEEIDRLLEENRKLKEEFDRLREENERLKREIDEYRKRHPSAVGVKNGKAYEIRQGIGSVFQNLLYPLYTEIEEE